MVTGADPSPQQGLLQPFFLTLILAFASCKSPQGLAYCVLATIAPFFVEHSLNKARGCYCPPYLQWCLPSICAASSLFIQVIVFPPQSVVRLSTQVGFSCRVFPLWRSLFEMNMHWFAIFLQIPNFVFLYLDFSTNNFILILVFLMAEKDLIVPNFYLYPLPAVGKLCEEPMGDISGFPGQMVQL